MAWFRRRRRGSTSTEIVPAATHDVVARQERAMFALAAHARQLGERVELVEARLNEMIEFGDHVATHDELLEVRVHSARTAAEVARLSVNLRAQIDDLRASMPTARDDRIANLAETILDLSDALDSTPRDVDRSSRDPWVRTA